MHSNIIFVGSMGIMFVILLVTLRYFFYQDIILYYKNQKNSVQLLVLTNLCLGKYISLTQEI